MRGIILLGVTRTASRRIQKGYFRLSSAIRLDSGTANYYSNRGQSYRKLGKPQVALSDFEAAIALEPSNASLVFNRGMALYDCGQYKKAIKDFTTALKDKKLTYRAYYNRGNCYRRLKSLDKSIDDLSQALNLEPGIHLHIITWVCPSLKIKIMTVQ